MLGMHNGVYTSSISLKGENTMAKEIKARYCEYCGFELDAQHAQDQEAPGGCADYRQGAQYYPQCGHNIGDDDMSGCPTCHEEWD